MSATMVEFAGLPADGSSEPVSEPTPLGKRFNSKLQAAIARAKRIAANPIRSIPKPMGFDEADPPFRDSRSAVRFEVGLEGNPPRPLSSTMIDVTSGERGFPGTDRSAMAGYIGSVLRRRGPLHYALLVVEVGRKSIDCTCGRPCCSGERHNLEWLSAVGTIAQEALDLLPVNEKRDYAYVWALLGKIFGFGKYDKFSKIASEFKLDEETVSRHSRTIHKWLRGAKAKKDEPAIEGVSQLAWQDAETDLRTWGVVG